ncbi:Putative hypothetical protein [Helicobacter mustelae 12198]|uniref:Uncharacterized protein n=1 Tax=Helicobacter mustelae (strain ATCC 43772 / CCUG 25715 / CIP 103759 / LMG 18044 / NCTC 12198 / R85-136P) TaxID=679897 RepID=D3UIZ5_HELM1|nr:Putative hypothetical protein [Helicobacter mustelae 12198]
MLRNNIDFILSQMDKEWILKALLDTGLERHQALSQQSLGFWLRAVDFCRIHN